MSEPVISTCSGISCPACGICACAVCACATCCACAARTLVNVSNDAEPIRVASLDVVGFIVIPPCRRHSFHMIGKPARLLDGHPHANRPSFPQRPFSPDLNLKLTGRCLVSTPLTPL